MKQLRQLVAVCLILCMALMSCEGAHSAPHKHHSHHAKHDSNALKDPLPCLGEYQLCGTGDCVLIGTDCGLCPAGSYKCPLDSTCAPNAAAYMGCPGLNGTHLDWHLPVEQRITAFIQEATLDEKIAQLQNAAPAIPRLGIPFYNWLNDDVHSVQQHHSTVMPDGCGLGATWDTDILFASGYIIGKEARATHNGLVDKGDRGLNENGSGMTTYAPNMNLVRDSRWGRNQEVYSEDPYLTSRLTVAYVTGQQGANETGTPYMMAGSCCKHYAAYDIENIPVDRYRYDAKVATRDFWESYLPAFEACVIEGQATSVMCSYNSMNGVPTCGDPNLLNGILRDRWNFTGFVVSDYDAWANLKTTHHACPDMVCAAAMGINAGMDQEGGGSDAINSMSEAIQQGLTTEEAVNTALSRLLRVRIGLGMLDPPTLNSWNQLSNVTDVENQAHMDYARYAAQKSICLYKNGDNVLPLAPSSVSPSAPNPIKLALIGPQWIDGDLLIGNYAQEPSAPGPTSLLQGVFDVLSLPFDCTYQSDYDYYQPGQLPVTAWSAQECAAMCSADTYCSYFTFYQNGCYLKQNNSGGTSSPGRVSGSCTPQPSVQFSLGCLDIGCGDAAYFPEAIALASESTHILVTLGLEWRNLEHEGKDRSDINLPYFQYELVSQLRANMTSEQKLICIFIHGGAFALQNLWTDCDAIVDTWYPGMRGEALSDVVFGYYNPGGRTAVTWYNHTNDLPDMGVQSFYPSTETNSKGITYRYFEGVPTLAFGYGLSYTTFSYSNLSVEAPTGACTWIYVTATVSNTGSMDGDEVVQLYVSQQNPSVPAPQIRLAGFLRVHIGAGESVNVAFSIDPAYHSVVVDENRDNFWKPTRLVEAGGLTISLGGAQPDFCAHSTCLTNTVTIPPPTQTVEECDVGTTEMKTPKVVRLGKIQA